MRFLLEFSGKPAHTSRPLEFKAAHSSGISIAVKGLAMKSAVAADLRMGENRDRWRIAEGDGARAPERREARGSTLPDPGWLVCNAHI
jgi:hypothetical protein